MARKLPWIKEDEPKPAKPRPRAATRPKRELSTSPDIEVKATADTLASSESTRPGKRKRAACGNFALDFSDSDRLTSYPTARTPSTSPPPGPPPVDYIHEGYDRDDIYIMVEDEFQAVAQSFTRHLHHAEYMRLKKQAREAPPKPAPKPAQNMSPETKKRTERGILQEMQREALKDTVRGSGTRNVESGAEEQFKDPWQSTHLAGLMSSSSQHRVALVGLEKIPSASRAAKGFGRGASDSSTKAARPKSILDIFGPRGRAELRRGEQNSNADMRDYDLEATVGLHQPDSRSTREPFSVGKERSGVQSINRVEEAVTTTPERSREKLANVRREIGRRTALLQDTNTVRPDKPELEGSITSGAPSEIATSVRRRVVADFDDDFDEAAIHNLLPTLPMPRPRQDDETKSRKKTEEKDIRDRKLRLAEVPTFLF